MRNTFTPPESKEPVWVWLGRGDASLMLSRASAPVLPEEQAVLFYLYFDDLPATREALERAGIPVGPIEYPFYPPRGEFRIQGLTLTRRQEEESAMQHGGGSCGERPLSCF